LSSFAAAFRIAPTFPPPSVDVVEAEGALRDGQLELAADLASRVRARLEVGHPLSSRAAAIEGHSNFQLARFASAEDAFTDARRAAQDDRDDNEALHGLALARIFGERADFEAPVAELWKRRHVSPTHLLRAATAELSRRRLAEGLAAPLYLEEPWHACPQVEDPRARSAFAYAAAYTLAQKSEYRLATEWVERFWFEVREYDLEFARPHAVWTTALIRLGLRRFGEAERLLQSLEDDAAEKSDVVRAFTAKILRARLLLQTGSHGEAAALMAEQGPAEVYPSWRGEYLATRAITIAVTGNLADAKRTADEALKTSQMAEVQMMAAAAHSIVDARRSDFDSASRLLQQGVQLGVWDPVVCALRTWVPLADGLAAQDCWRNVLEQLYASSNDFGLARRAGFRTRSNRPPSEVLTPRELEVLGLIARGMRNSDIARALFISQSTAKVHVRHVLEKLGVRTRAEAVSRLEMFS
jgi:DNA-binding CsgD family transcriptional regulator